LSVLLIESGGSAGMRRIGMVGSAHRAMRARRQVIDDRDGCAREASTTSRVSVGAPIRWYADLEKSVPFS
jgi:hypothetical protein